MNKSKPMPGRGSAIANNLIQELFESAANAADKGQAQWFTPPAWAKVLAIPLCQYRPHIVDLACGNGQLLAGSSRHSRLIGCDLDPSLAPVSDRLKIVTADVTKLYPLLRAVRWRADVFALNPPYDLHWYRSDPNLNRNLSPNLNRLSQLAESDCFAVADAFTEHDGRTPRECIDSTVASLCIALDRMSTQGEGYLIGNESTLQRLILGKGAPHEALAPHIWAHLAIAGNICQPDCGLRTVDFKTGVIYFARAHQDGVKIEREVGRATPCAPLEEAATACREFLEARLTARKGPEPKDYSYTEDCNALWDAAAEEYARLYRQDTPLFNLWLAPSPWQMPGRGSAVIRTALSLFDQSSGRVDANMAATLFSLNGKQPIQLVVQRAQRKALEAAVNGVDGKPSPWRVDPKLTEAVADAIKQYDAVRSPLYPLPAIQRLGYLDEQDEIKCLKSLKLANGNLTFTAGQTYPMRSATVAVNRQGTKLNVHGVTEEVEWDGQELAFFIRDNDGLERCFMEERLRAPGVKVNVLRHGATRKKRDNDIAADECPIDYTLQQLVAAFEIPDVPDVAERNPAAYQRHLETLKQIEAVLARAKPGASRFAFKPFQREDYARAALQAGIILGHDTGLGKTLAAFIMPLLWLGILGSNETNQLVPGRAVLLVVPGDGHDQTDDESFLHLKTKAVRLNSQEDFLRLSIPDPGTGNRSLPPAYYITSYQQLSGNGVLDFPKLNRANPLATMRALNLKERHAAEWFEQRGELYKREYTQLGVTAEMPWAEIEAVCQRLKRDTDSDARKREIDAAYFTLKHITPGADKGQPAGYDEQADADEAEPRPGTKLKKEAPVVRRFSPVGRVTPCAPPGGQGTDRPTRTDYGLLTAAQQQFIRSELAIWRHLEFSEGIRQTKTMTLYEPNADSSVPGRGPAEIGSMPIKCVYSPSLADLAGDCFGAVVVDEGTKMKGEDTAISLGVRQINAPYRLVMSGTPIKNRFPDVFQLAHFVCGGLPEPSARFPYGVGGRDQFAEDFMVSERNLTKEENSDTKRRFRKLTAQVCNIHLAWKLLAPIILRRRKEACGEPIVPKLRHVVRVPLGLYQAAAYQFHLRADYRDKNGMKAVGAQLQALRMAAANPASELLKRPDKDATAGSPRSHYAYIPKVATAITLIIQALERHEQVMVGSAFQDSLDSLSARLREAGVRHLVLDGRVSPNRRGLAARQFKAGPPKAVAEGLMARCGAHPVLLAGVECMAELHNFPLCNNVMLMSYSWAFDKFEQFINRAHRMNSPWPVNVWSIICQGSVDRVLECNIHEKGDASNLVLDGCLLGENPSEVNLAELLHIAHKEFKDAKTMDEIELQRDWPRLRARLGKAFLNWPNVPNGSWKTEVAPEPAADPAKPAKPGAEPSRGSAADTDDLPLWRRKFRHE
jgi:hypothetical protein